MWIAECYVIDMNLKLWREEIDDDNSREMLQRV